MADNGSFLLFNEQWDAISILDDAQRGKLMQAFFHESGADAEMPELDQATKGIFLLIQKRIRENRERYESKCSKNKANGSLGGRPKNQEKPNGFFQNPPDADSDADTDFKEEETIVSLSPADADDCEPSPTVKSEFPDCPHQEIVALYHETLPELPQVRQWNAARAKHLTARWRETMQRLKSRGDPCTRESGLEWWRKFFLMRVRPAPLLMGKSSNWTASLPWLVKAENYAKTLEGNYLERQRAA